MNRIIPILSLLAVAASCGETADNTCTQEKNRECMLEHGQFCEAGECVDPWSYGSPQWSRCESDPHATAESLHDKMVYFEDIARRLHIHPQLKWIASVSLPADPPPDEQTATWQDVEVWHSGENDGLFSGLYLAAEAFRYGATRDPEALEAINLLLEGEKNRMDITGVDGIFTRQMIPPGVDGIACPADPAEYIPDVEKDDNQWVRVESSGCVATYDGALWVESGHCGLDDFAGWCWLDNVSKDEYAGHMFALGVLYKLVDDPQVQATVKDLLAKVGNHLVDTRMQFTDWDGRVTEHGRLWAMALDDFPGFNAAMALAFIKMSAVATGEVKLDDWYHDCLLQEGGELDCIQQALETPQPYTEHLVNAGMYVGQGSCTSNWNNHSMHMASLHNLIWYERDPDLRTEYQNSLELDVFNPPDTPRALITHHNAWYDFIYAAHKHLGPESSGPAYAVVEDAVCMLRQFPASKMPVDLTCPPETCVLSNCTNRFGNPIIENAREVHERCIRGFLWWTWPYSPDDCTAQPQKILSPTDYLLAYWMGRYYGFITEGM